MNTLELVLIVVASLAALCCLEKGIESNNYFGWVRYDYLWIGFSVLIVLGELVYVVVRHNVI